MLRKAFLSLGKMTKLVNPRTSLPYPVLNVLFPYTNNYYFSTMPTKAQEHENEIVVEDEEDISDDEESTGIKKQRSQRHFNEETLQQEECKFVEAGDKLLIKSHFGLFELKGSLIPQEKIKNIKTLYYLRDGVPSNYVRKILKADPHCLVIFEPSSHYPNMRAIYRSYQKKLYMQFYGTKKKPRNPFKNCKSNKEIFNLSRRIKIQIKSLLTRICIIVNYDASLRIRGENVPYSDTLKSLLHPEKTAKDDTKVGFYKHDYLIPVSYWQGIHSSDQWEKAGIPVEFLGGKKIYPLYSVWPPTNQHYLTLLNDYLEENKDIIKAKKPILEIGSGTGVLSFMLVHKCGCKDIYAIDSNIKAVECTRYNAQILDVAGAIKAFPMDLVQSVNEKKSEENLKKLNFPKKYELIIANPPWITASKLNTEHELDNGIFDPNEEMLVSIFKFATLGQHLTTETPLTKNGVLLLYYSDLSQILELQSPDRIEQLCNEYKLVLRKTMSTKFSDVQVRREVDHDPLINFKNQAKIFLYEITRM